MASARAGNVIGGGDWSEDRIIPDMIRAWQATEPMKVRRPQAVRPWQHVLEPLSGYLTLARKLWDHPGWRAPIISDRKAVTPFRCGNWSKCPALPTAAATWCTKTVRKARMKPPGWRSILQEHAPNWGSNRAGDSAEAVSRTMAWYKAQKAGTDARSLCESDIADYEKLP